MRYVSISLNVLLIVTTILNAPHIVFYVLADAPWYTKSTVAAWAVYALIWFVSSIRRSRATWP